MLTQLKLQNFKCFSALSLRLEPLTLLTGFNAAGKSTTLQSLLLLAIDTEKLDAPLKWENLEGGQENFPHIYGPVKMSAVVHAVNFEPDPNGSFNLPADLA